MKIFNVMSAAALLGLVLCGPSHAAEIPVEFEACLAMDDDRERLTCYDEAVQEILDRAEAKTTKKTLSVVDVLMDFEILKGKTRTVAGIMSINSKRTARLFASETSPHSLAVSLEAIEPEVLRRLFECGNCPVTVSGKIENLAFIFEGITAQEIRFR